MTEAAIEIRSLEKTYRDGIFRRRAVPALGGVSFSVARGEIFGLLGPNGAGKTTLIKILLGIVRKTGGDATVLGRSPGHRAGRQRIGYLPESHRIPRHHTGLTALEYYGALSGVSCREIRRRRPEVLELVGLERWGTTNVRKYSKGMQQRLGLAQALLHDPELLVLDEPTDGVDPIGRSEMRTLLQRLKSQGKTIFLNSHHLQEIELVCDRVVIMTHGKVRREGGVNEITSMPQINLFLTLVGDEATIRLALGSRPLEGWVMLDQRTHQVTIEVHDQADTDRVIDDLRGRQIGIADLTRQRQTLEEVFLGIVSNDTAAVVDAT